MPVPTLSPRTTLLCLALLTSLLSVACGEPADGRVDEATVALQLIEIDAQTECDSATNPGDFWIDAEIRDLTFPGWSRIDQIQNALTQSHVGVTAVDQRLEGSLRQEPGREIRLDVYYDEYDGGDSYDGTAADSVTFSWDEEDWCWQQADDPALCVAPGETAQFELPIDDPSGKCHATLLWAFEAQTARRTPAEAHSGWWSFGGELDIAITDTASGTEWTCVYGYAEAFVDPEADVEFQGQGDCERAYFRDSYSLGFSIEGRFLSDTEVSGVMVFESESVLYEVSFEGTRTLRSLAITLSEVIEDPLGGGDLHWQGTFEMRQ